MDTSDRPGRRISSGSTGGAPSPGAVPVESAGSSQRVSNRGSEGAVPVPTSVSTGPRAGIRGRVLNAGQRGISSATVAISSGPFHPDIAAVTDDNGDFFLSDLSPGNYQITVHKSGYQFESLWVNSVTGQPVTITLRTSR